MRLFPREYREEPLFRDRYDAGRKLVEHLSGTPETNHALVLALPRGGVPVGFEVARALGAELDIFVARKLGLPGQEELAVGAIASGGIRVLNEAIIREIGLRGELIDEITAREELELKRREEIYRAGRPAIPITGRNVILVDDGLATGASMKAAATALRLQAPAGITVAVPVAARETCDEFRSHVDRIVCAFTPAPFVAVGIWYENFSQTTDREVQQLLETQRASVADQTTDSP